MASGGAAPIHEAHDRRDPRPRPRGLHRTESTGPGSTLGSATRRHGRRRRTPTFHAQGAAMSESHHAVFGHPITHSLSPRIHARFSRQTGIALRFEAIDATPDTFATRSDEHTSELQSLIRTSYAVFCLKKKKTKSMKTN